jgi:Mg/Co/Ni transporter MgtE
VASYVVGSLTVAGGVFMVAISLVACRHNEPRLSGRLIAVGVLHGAVWLAIGVAVLVRNAMSSPATGLAFISAVAAIAIASNLLGCPIWWKRIGDPDAWRGKAP